MGGVALARGSVGWSLILYTHKKVAYLILVQGTYTCKLYLWSGHLWEATDQLKN